jgi:RimJ/RimL family protein N-acetyltransferase
MTLQTTHLELIPATPALLEAELAGRAALAAALGREVPASYPPDLYDDSAVRFTLYRLQSHPDEAGWWSYYLARRDGGPVIGVAGYKGLPSGYGVVEIGYSVLVEFRRQGYATEAAGGLVGHAFATPGVTAVIAHTMPELTASIRVMAKCGFVFDGHADEPNVIRYRLERAAWEAGRG